MVSKVVSFRVDEKLFRQIEQAKQVTRASYTDLMKRGADICINEVQSKLNEINRLSARAKELRMLAAEREAELEKSIEQQKAERQAQLDKEFEAKRAAQENELRIARSNLVSIQDKIDVKQDELAELKDEIEVLREKRDEISEQLVQYQRKHGENQMTTCMMMLALMGAAGNMLQPPSQGGAVASHDSNEASPQQSISANYNYLERAQPGAPTLATTITGLLSILPIFMMVSMMTSMTAPPKKKPLPPEAEARPNALADYIRRSREARAEASKRKLEIAESEEASEEETEEDEVPKDDELEEEPEESSD